MAISEVEVKKEKKILNKVNKLLDDTLDSLGMDVKTSEDDLIEFKKMMWTDANSFDEGESQQVMAATAQEAEKFFQKQRYFNRLRRIKGKPYFASIVFKDDDGNIFNIYMSLTYLKDSATNNILYDWRSPICSLFYDYEVGPCSYIAPMGKISGHIDRKRQYTIKDGKLLHIFDNSINIDDELLQEVLANESNDKMKNIVNTIQMEQNRVIRNTDDRNLIVQGIAGSGKTSVALHRIAFLLYKIDNLKSNNILIFSPNRVFSEYISNVLPELGEDNTMQTTINDFLDMEIKEFKKVESFTAFIERSYTGGEDFEFIKYKQSDIVYEDIDKYIDNICKSAKFMDDLFNRDYSYTKDELNFMLYNRYGKFPLCERVKFMAEKISEVNFNGKLHKAKTIERELYERLNIDRDLVKIYIDFFNSKFSRMNRNISYIKENKNLLNYDDACLYVYMKCKLFGYNYNTYIKQVVIDEAQDYGLGQLKLIKKIFKNASYTILGDVNQTINPYYKYDSLEDLTKIFEDSKYIELTKTYRSSEEIIEYSNRVLGLNYVTAIRRGSNIPVIERKEDNLYEQLISDIDECNKYGKSIAIVTKNDIECDKVYKLLKNKDISKIDNNTKKFNRKFVVVPVYMAKGLEFDSVIIYTDINNKFTLSERYLYYVAITRAQHKLIVYNQ